MSRETASAEAFPTRTRYGAAHPERVENPLWELSMRENWSGYDLRQHLKIELGPDHFRQRFSNSAYRESTPGPFWSWQRYGRTSTPLPDGRVVLVAGEHEDSYDPDFCIYNDVVVEIPGGKREFYLYPKDVFPPTDFHTATLAGSEIILIGSLGYADLRRPGETQVLRLDIRTLCISRVETTGDNPGWLSNHIAELIDGHRILVSGGKVQTSEGYVTNPELFEFDLSTRAWRRRHHADLTIFPVSKADYLANRNPRFGTSNPERVTNIFWQEMARRRWPPSRARLHYGDPAPPKPELVFSGDVVDASGLMTDPNSPQWQTYFASLSADIERSKLKRSDEDIVWTAVRENAAEIELPDGRKLTIGGEVKDYGDDYADPWVYNDLIAWHPDGRIEIFAYPKSAFPILSSDGCCALVGSDVLIFGIIERKHHPELHRGPAVLRLDTKSYAITVVAIASSAAHALVYAGAVAQDGSKFVFPVARERASDPELGIAYDTTTSTWSEPFPWRHPRVDEE